MSDGSGVIMASTATYHGPSARTGVGWRMRAACCGLDPDIFFPAHVSSRREIAAKRVCEQCPVVGECLSWAMSHREDWGIWGGLSENERRRLRASWLASRAGRERRTFEAPLADHRAPAREESDGHQNGSVAVRAT